MLKTTLLFLLFFGHCSCALAQETFSLTGSWRGTLVQNASPFNLASDFQLSMNLRQSGIFVHGTAYVSFDDHYVELKLSGHQMPNGSYRLIETEILRSTDISKINAEWCYKTYDLVVSYTEGGLVLTGPWTGITGSQYICVPGGVTLHKQLSRA